ncbi:MAG: circularly permuted type 2 ATP-grasp protein [Nocardiaceae bacterium]|nr:circularly permuted type 2 ATP-grasp protein [Nocardiaceae bacterium]
MTVLDDEVSAYRTSARRVFDEYVDRDGQVRPQWQELSQTVLAGDTSKLSLLRARVDHLVENDGITYNELIDEAARGVAPKHGIRKWQLDGLPLIVSSDDWAVVEAGMLQRSRLLDAILGDLYGPMKTVRRGLIPPEVVFADPAYIRAARGIRLPGRHQLFLHAADVARRADGSFFVAADRTQAPSGVGYSIADRRVISRALPALFQEVRPRPLSGFAQAMRLALIDAAPSATDDPLVVVLSPGSHSETAFDQAHLATVLGFPLVESADLVVRDGRLWMRALGTLRPVDVVLRRVDAAYADPLDLRPDSRLGVVGLVEVMRRGAVTVVNSLGSGILENPTLPRLLPQLCRDLLDEDLLLPSVRRYWGGVDTERQHMIARAGTLVFERISGGHSIVGSMLSRPRRKELAAAIEADPSGWVARELPIFSSAPTSYRGTVQSAPVEFRMFTVAGTSGYVALNGGLGSVLHHLDDNGLLVSTTAKDVWVRPAAKAEVGSPSALALPEILAAEHETPESITSPRVLSDLFWIGRYSERAEQTARMLLAVRDKLTDYRDRPWLAGGDCLPVLLDAINALSPSDAGMTPDETLRSMTIDPARPGSLQQSIDCLQDACRAVRDQMSLDSWAFLATLDRAVNMSRNDDDEVTESEAHRAIVGALLALSGLASESMVHDAGWYLTDAGKRIERALQLTLLITGTLTHAHAPSAERAIIDFVLAATESSVTYRRRNRGRAQASALAQLILLDETNPRSLAFQLEQLRVDLQKTPGATGSTPAERLAEDARALLRRADPHDLERSDENGVRTDLVELMSGIHKLLRELSDVLSEKMAVPTAMQPLWGTAAGRYVS